jgi:hypothetical protein
MSIHLGKNHRWPHARQGRPERQAVTWDNLDGTTSSVSVLEPSVAEWLAAGNEPTAPVPPDPGPLTTTIADLERRIVELEAKVKGA